MVVAGTKRYKVEGIGYKVKDNRRRAQDPRAGIYRGRWLLALNGLRFRVKGKEHRA